MTTIAAFLRFSAEALVTLFIAALLLYVFLNDIAPRIEIRPAERVCAWTVESWSVQERCRTEFPTIIWRD